MSNISPAILEKAPLILKEIQKARSILLHCHVNPDPDSVGSALAMRFALEALGKKATVIRGDSEIPEAFSSFPGVKDIVAKNFFEVDLKEYDLFIILDSGGLEMISHKDKIEFPESLNTIVIDHHASNKGYAKINLIDSSSSTAFIIYELIKEWKVELTRDMALNLFTGMYTDSGGFKYSPTDYRVLEAAAECAKVAPDYIDTIFALENSNTKEALYFKALALNSIETFCDDSVAIASVSYENIMAKKITDEIVSGSDMANTLKAVIGWNIGILMTEREPNNIKINLRSRDANRFDVSKLAVVLGGGGHRAAAGACIRAPLKEAKQQVVAKIKELYNL